MLVAGLALALALGGCQGVKDQLGLGKQSPDEFRVQARAPLSVPPDFTDRPLPAPQPGATRPQEGTTTQQAKSAVFRIDDDQEVQRPTDASFTALSPGEQALLMAAGADKSDSQIREVVDRETKRINAEDEDFIDSLVFWREPEKPGVIVDADEESRRINENVALGKSVTTGQTPTVERRKKALFEGIF
ncbi:MAG: DUF3035 domain-containing protein [Pseudomonadota bacterium]